MPADPLYSDQAGLTGDRECAGRVLQLVGRERSEHSVEQLGRERPHRDRCGMVASQAWGERQGGRPSQPSLAPLPLRPPSWFPPSSRRCTHSACPRPRASLCGPRPVARTAPALPRPTAPTSTRTTQTISCQSRCPSSLTHSRCSSCARPLLHSPSPSLPVASVNESVPSTIAPAASIKLTDRLIGHQVLATHAQHCREQHRGLQAPGAPARAHQEGHEERSSGAGQPPSPVSRPFPIGSVAS